MQRAKELGLFICHHCDKIHHIATTETHCQRCHSRLHHRFPNSEARSWALIITGILLFIPAQTYPIMKTQSLGQVGGDTIISGVIYFAQSGSWGIAAIIFIASFLVPLAKLLGLAAVLLAIDFHWLMSQRQCTTLYRWIDFIGRWSMLDIFVVAIMVALVKMGNLMSIDGAKGASAFALMVVVSMLATATFDPRLIWDGRQQGERSK